MGTDLGRFSTFSHSVFRMEKGRLLCTGMEIGVEAVMGVGSIEEGPGTGQECGTESVNQWTWISIVSSSWSQGNFILSLRP